MNRHPLELEPRSGSIEPGHAGRHRDVSPVEIAVCLAVIFLVLAAAGPSRVAAGAGGVVGGLVEMVGNVFDVGGFLRPSW